MKHKQEGRTNLNDACTGPTSFHPNLQQTFECMYNKSIYMGEETPGSFKGTEAYILGSKKKKWTGSGLLLCVKHCILANMKGPSSKEFTNN